MALTLCVGMRKNKNLFLIFGYFRVFLKMKYFFKDFKGFISAELDLSEPLTVLIGPNGSGKSNVIEAIELLSFIAPGGLLYEITDIGRSGKLEVRGGIQACPRYGKFAFALCVTGKNSSGWNSWYYNYGIEIRTSPSARVIEEKYSDYSIASFNTIFETVSTDLNVHRVKYNNFARGKPQANVSPMQSALSQYKNFTSDENFAKYKKQREKRDACLQSIDHLIKSLRSFIFDPNPKLMRNYERIGDHLLTKTGSNLSAVLYVLSENSKQETSDKKEVLQRLLDWIKQLPNEPYQKFDFVTTQLNDVIFGLREGESAHLVSANVLSDGTLRCLAVLTALETVEQYSLIIIEEFDNGLHPSRVGMLVKAIEDCCQRRKLKVLVTTHNPATLNALSPQQLNGVVLCTWNSEEKASNLIRLSELPYREELLEQGQLGDLVTRQVIDEYLRPNFSDERQEKMLKWLADF